MSNKPSISVVIPTYNASAYLREAIDSVVNQTFTDLEIICVNDGSTDDSLEILQQYAAADERFKIIDVPNGGYGKAMNLGMAEATGVYFAIFEPDDILPPNAYAVLYNLAKQNDAEIAKGCFSFFTGDSEDREYPGVSHIDEQFIGRCINPKEELSFFRIFVNTWTSLYKMDFIRKWDIRHHESPGASFQDTGFFLLSLAFATRVFCTNEIVYYYRIDNSKSSVYAIAGKPFAIKKEFEYIKNKLITHVDIWEKCKPAYLCRRIMAHVFTYSGIRESFKLEYLRDLREELMGIEDFDRKLLDPTELRILVRALQSADLYLLEECVAPCISNAVDSVNTIAELLKQRYRCNMFYKKTPNKVTYKLFGIPIWGKRRKGDKKIYSIFGLPIRVKSLKV